MATLLIDNHDSFSFNLSHLVAEVYGAEPLVLANDDPRFAALDLTAFEALFISPGPGHPAREHDFGASRSALDAGIPVLGVCLGHQGICHAAGGEVDIAPEPVHGRTSPIFHDGQGLFAGLPSPFDATRYHSLAVTHVPEDLEVLARTSDGVVMAVAHRRLPTFGIQFHPESIATELGAELIANFRRQTSGRTRRSAPPRPGRPGASGQVPASKARPAARDVLAASWRRLECEVDPQAAFDALFAGLPACFWLDGETPFGEERRFSYMGDARGPLAEIVTHDAWTGTTRVESRAGTRHEQGPFLDFLARALEARAIESPAPVPFGLGYVGYLGYELKAECGGRRAHRSDTPDAALLFVDRLVAFDHAAGAVFIGELRRCGEPLDDSWSRKVAATLEGLATEGSAARESAEAEDDGAPPIATPSMPGERYLDRIAEAMREIVRGESYEVCLTGRARVDGEIDLAATWRALRRSNPAAYAALFSVPGVSVVGSSPERFLKVSAAGLAESRPIKGTARRDRDPARDRRSHEALLASGKDRAENLMIVDLVRNDLARVSEVGSVEVIGLAELETLPTVHQLVSTIRSRLAPGRSAIDCVRAAFPPGSMTGAPKERTMEIVDRLEGGPRGVYSGALGWFGLDGAIDLGLVIRSVVAGPTGVTVGAGGAIVALSDPAAELAEVELKLAAVGAGLRRPRSRGPDIDPALGLFETLLIVEGRPIRLDAHLARLAASLRSVYDSALPAGIDDSVREAAAGTRFGRLRLDVATAGEEPRISLRVASVDESIVFPESPTSLYRVDLATAPGPHKWADRGWIEAIEAERPGTVPLFVLGSTDEVLEASRANVFLVRDGILRTPVPDGRILPGTVRRETIEIARSLGVEVEEAAVAFEDLLAADEVFLTGSVRGIEPVERIDRHPLRHSGPVTALLAAELRSRFVTTVTSSAPSMVKMKRP
jgi:para-aminobenzoate synthetase